MKPAIAIVALLLAFPAWARDPAVALAFQYDNPCPSTGQRYGSCPGFVRDHIWPLCAGGPDTTENMQWQTTEDAKIKDRWEWQLCRAQRNN